MYKTILSIGIILSGLAVALGAFGAHGLKKLVSAETVATYQTGVQYQMYHALALILLAIVSTRATSGWFNYSAVMFVAGILLFSGSLYLIVAFHAMEKTFPTALGLITPLGGLCFIAGWVFFLIGVLKN